MSLEATMTALNDTVTKLKDTTEKNNALLSQIIAGAGGKAGAAVAASTAPAATPTRRRAAAPTSTIEQVVVKAKEALDTVGREETERLLKSFGATKSRELKPEQYDAFIAGCDALLEAPAEGEAEGEI